MILAPFRVRSFRYQWPADLLTSWASEMETIILGWYVMVHTGSVVLLTVFGSLQFLGTLLAPDSFGTEERANWFGVFNHWEMAGYYAGAIVILLAKLLNVLV